MDEKRSDPIWSSFQWKGRALTGTSETSNGEAKKEMIEGIFYSMEKIEMIWNDFHIHGPESKSLLGNSMDKIISNLLMLWIFTETFAHLTKSMENQLEEEFECLSRVME